MKSIKLSLLLLVLLGPVTASVAWAHGHHHGGGGHVGIFVDPWPLFYPGFGYYPYRGYGYGYEYPVVVAPVAPTVYVQQGSPASAPQYSPAPAQAAPSSDWYYCAKPDGYYPYVQNCPSGWLRTPAVPASQQ